MYWSERRLPISLLLHKGPFRFLLLFFFLYHVCFTTRNEPRKCRCDNKKHVISLKFGWISVTNHVHKAECKNTKPCCMYNGYPYVGICGDPSQEHLLKDACSNLDS